METQREGWLVDQYIRIYASADRARVAAIYRFDEFLPGYEPWGSWGQDALCLSPERPLFLIPWIPLAASFRQEHYARVAAFEEAARSLRDATPSYQNFGKEVHFINPVIFGGDPSDKQNIALIEQSAHAEICVFWNRAYARLRQGDV